MTDGWIIPKQVFDNGALLSGMAVQVVDGRATDMSRVAEVPLDAPQHAVQGVLIPGFVDLQVNGGGGVLFNAAPTLAGLMTIATAHRRFGTVALMPTVITDAPAVLAKAADAVIAMKALCGQAGLHIEGPHIAAARRGTHAAEHVRPFDDATLGVVRKLRAAGVTVMMTLAPEVVPIDRIAALVKMGVIVSLGHSDATAEQAHAAFAAGARSVTHLYNAMSQMQGRAPGLAGAAINSDAYVGIICDGAHVDDAMVALACRARPVAGRMVLVSDAMPTVGGPDHFDLYGQRIALRDGRLINAEGNLAGAHATMLWGVQRLAGQVGLPLEQALQMAITAPSELLGKPHLGRVTGRFIDDLFLLDDRLALQPLSGNIRHDIA
ncbi:MULTISPECIES: N-acetylglucosamine-6-phosphate deacetylase [unclassified Yoonia]|uniref:N-acetylglucosamine-6-phosphate deacetylase n=1 Tax=unclassified Yoonia TaxID=2629118 RepID=UPI002AFFEC0B|nr:MULTISPECIES: N-acetylglucosamine-6-phosphate deacetylase [unclassified Yoonia]